jgi:hypothetical protein
MSSSLNAYMCLHLDLFEYPYIGTDAMPLETPENLLLDEGTL